MNLLDSGFAPSVRQQCKTGSIRSVSYHYMMEKLMFLFSQLDEKSVEAIVANIENIYGVSSIGDFGDLEDETSMNDMVGYAVTRFLYAVSGQSSDNIALAVTCAQIRAIQYGADDCDDVEVFS